MLYTLQIVTQHAFWSRTVSMNSTSKALQELIDQLGALLSGSLGDF